MSALKKFLPGKKKSKKSTSSSIQSGASEPNLADLGQMLGYKNVKEKDLPKLHKAAWIGDLNKLKQLLKKGDANSMDRHHRTPLHYACVKGHNEIAQWLCANRANLGICDEDGRTALMKAVEAASESCVEILLNHGAEANVVDVNLTTPLHIAATNGSIPIATLLLERGARVNASDSEKITPLYVAASLNFPEFLEFLLKEYALVNEPDVYGRTPLIAAAMEGFESVVKILLDYGADTEVKDKEGWKASDHAAMTGNHSISDLIEEYIQDEEPSHAEQEAANVNFGSGVGSPFRSTSTQPSTQQSTYGGPAINITVDSEDDSIGNDSPKRADFQNSWADSDSELEAEATSNVKGPILANALKRNESTQSKTSLSKIPIAASKHHKDDASSKLENSPSRTESKIPRFEPGSKDKSSISKEDISGSSHSQAASKIPKAVAGKGSPGHQPANYQSKSEHGDLESKIPRLSSASMSKTNADRPTIESQGSKKDALRQDISKTGKGESLGWENASVSDFDSESEDFSETDILAALTGTPTKKVGKKTDSLPRKVSGKKSLEVSVSPDMGDSEKILETEEAIQNEGIENENEGTGKEEKDVKIKDEEIEKDESEWDSTTDEISTSKPNLNKLMRKEDEEKKEDFDLDVDFDSSIAITEGSSPEDKDKLDKSEEKKLDVEEEKDRSEFSDFSLDDGKQKNESKTKDTENGDEQDLDGKNDNGKKDMKSIKAQMEALGLEAGSSFSSFSENESFGDLDASLTKHDKMFSSLKSKEIESIEEEPPRQLDLQAQKKESKEENAPAEAKIENGNQNVEEKKEGAVKDEKGEKSKSAKAQYDALGIEFSDESSLETESEWEASLKKKKMNEELKTAEAGRNDLKERNEDVDEDDEKESEKSESVVEKSDNRNEREKNDSEFISDESFSVNTEDQLEELEESRLKKADEDDNLSKDFNESDFSFSENNASKDETSVELDNTNSNEEGNSRSEISKEIEESNEQESSEEKMSDEGELETDEEIAIKKERIISDEISHNHKESKLVVEESSSDSAKEIKLKDVDTKELKSDENETLKQGEKDEKAAFLRNIVDKKEEKKKIKEIGDEKGNEKRKISDAERKKSLEAMLSPIQPVTVQNIESEIMQKEEPDRQEMQPNLQVVAGPENVVSVEPHSFDELEEIEEEFERKLKEKEMESIRSSNFEDEGSKNRPSEGKPEAKIRIKKGAEEDQMDLAGENDKDLDVKSGEMDFERQKMRYQMEMKIKKHQEELRQKEREFDAELRRRENEEKERRQQQMAEKEKERKRLEEMQREREMVAKEKADIERKKRELEEKEKKERREKEEKERIAREEARKQLEESEKKGAEEEIKRLEEEREGWEKKKGILKGQKGKTDLEEASKRRKQEEMKAAESSKRLKEQEELLKKMEEKTEKKGSSGDNVKHNDIEELMEIERIMREQEKEEKKKISQTIFDEDLLQIAQSTSAYSAQFLQEDYISPVQRQNQFVENEILLEPLRTRSPEQGPSKLEILNKSGKMKEESELLLKAAVDKTNALMNGEKRRTKDEQSSIVRLSPRQKQLHNDDLSDYGSADIDEITKVKDDVDHIIHTPGSDAVDVPSYHRAVDYPIASTPFSRYDPNGVEYNNIVSPISRPKSAPLIMDENEISPSKQGTPMALYASLSQSGHFQDSKALMKMQDALKESKRETERMKEKNFTLENVKKEMETDLREMQRTVEVLSRSQTDVEKVKLEMEMEMRDIKYRLDNEIQSRIMAEGLVSQLKEQLKRGDDKLAGEAGTRQSVELAYKTLEAEFKKRENLMNQFENEVNDLRFALYHEREARINQEQMYKDQLQQHEILLEETQKTSLQHAQTLNQLEVSDHNRQSAESSANQLKVELAKSKSELTRVNAQLEDVKSTYESEVSRLRNKLQDKMDELVKSEREQFQAQMQIEAEKSTAKAEQLRLASSLDNEIANKKRLETELNVIKTQLQNASKELERVSRTKSLTESEVSKFKEESYKDRSKHDRELASSKDEVQRIFIKLDASERRCDALESELQAAKIALAEKSGQVVMSSRELDYKSSLLSQMEEKFRHEKEMNHRLASKIDNGSERSSVLQREIDNLRRELETANQRTVDCDKAARDAQERFQALLTKAKEDFDKERNNLEQRIQQLNDSTLRYKEERAEDKEDMKLKENEIRIIQKELNDLAKSLSAAEAAKEIQSKNNGRLEEDNSKLCRQTAVLEKELKEVTSLKNELEGKLEDLNEQLEHALKVSDHTNNKLMQKNNDIHHEKLSRSELEKAVTRLKVEKVELDSELREEQAKCEMILDDLRKSNDARESLEKILANLKSTNVHLEEKLQSETLSRAQHERDAEDHKGLWNSEVKSRSRLGLQLVTMEKEIQKLKTELDDERRKTIQIEELKRSLESKIDIHEKRSLQQQKESSAMKNKLKQYQRRIKDFENGESRIPKIYNEFERERDVMLNNTSNLRRQVDSLIEQLRQEQESRSQAETNSKRNDQELTDLRTKEKMLSFEKAKLERENELLEEELDKLKNFYERNYIDKGSLDTFKRDIETKARLEINRKLQDVNMQLEEQAVAREAYDRVRNETESKSKKELEQTISGLKSELSYVKSALQEGIIKSGTYETEANRIRELYQHELSEKQKLSEKVEKLNIRSARSSLERPRTSYPTELGQNSFKNANSLFLSAERDEHPTRLGLRTSDLTNQSVMGSFTTPNLRASSAPRDYLPIYRRDYLT